MSAPATAPIGPSTTAPDTAPSAASPARSCALASNEMSEPAISAPTRKVLMASSPITVPKRLEKCGGTKVARTSLKLHKKARFRFPARAWDSRDAVNVAVICPTCQSRRRFTRRYLTKLRYEVSASISSGPRWVATIGIGEPGVE